MYAYQHTTTRHLFLPTPSAKPQQAHDESQDSEELDAMDLSDRDTDSDGEEEGEAAADPEEDTEGIGVAAAGVCRLTRFVDSQEADVESFTELHTAAGACCCWAASNYRDVASHSLLQLVRW
jgi:hypothetical protein